MKASHVPDVLEDVHHELVDALRRASELGDKAVLTAGNALSAIVGESMEQMKTASVALKGRDGEQVTLGGLLKEQGDAINDYVGSFDQHVGQLGQAAQAGIVSCRKIARFVGEFDEAIMTSDALSVYMKIEVARLPQEDQHVGVIAEELKSLSLGLRQLATGVRAISVGLSAELVALSASVDAARARRAVTGASLQSSIQSIDEVASKLEDILRLSANEGAPSEILQRSQEALSRLQYHDPLIQDVQTVDSLVAEARTQVSERLGRPEVVAPLAYAVRLGDKPGASSAGAGDADAGGDAGDAAAGGDVFLF